MNRAKYITDNTNWGKKDYWGPLPASSWPASGTARTTPSPSTCPYGFWASRKNLLRVVAVKDMNLNVGHAVLVVFLGGKSYLLDNQIKQVVETKRVRHYQPRLLDQQELLVAPPELSGERRVRSRTDDRVSGRPPDGAVRMVGEYNGEMSPEPLTVLHTVFGFPTFRGQQQEVVAHIVDGGVTPWCSCRPAAGNPSAIRFRPCAVRASASSYRP